MNNSLIFFCIFSIILLMLCFFNKDIEHSSKKNFDLIKKKWKKIENDNNALDWLNTISNYNTHSLCFISSILLIILLVIIQILILNSLNIQINEFFKFLILEIFGFLLIIYLVLTKMIDYFRWHIMCRNFGCTSIHIKD